MKYLKDLNEEDKNILKIKVGNAHLNLQYRSSHKAFKDVVDLLISDVGQSFEVNIIITNVIIALKHLDVGFYLSRYAGFYTKYNNDNPTFKKVSWRKMNTLLNLLEDKGYIVNYSGYKDALTKDRMSGCVLFKEKLINLFDKEKIDKFGLKYPIVSAEVRRNEPTTYYKNGDVKTSVKVLKKFKGISLKRKEVDEINQWLINHKFTFIFMEKIVELQRIYLDDLERCGRFYFSDLQCISKEKRELFKINNEPIQEVDIQSQHLRIAASLQGVVLPVDFEPYKVDTSKILQGDSSKIRSLCKTACMFLLNSGTPSATMTKFIKQQQTLIDKYKEEGNYKRLEENPIYGIKGWKNANKLIPLLKEHNSYAKDYFGIKGGVFGNFQNIDSEIMLRVLQKMKYHDAPILPYHDSGLCKCSDVDLLEKSFKEAWEEIVGYPENCVLTRKYDTTDKC